MKKLLVAALFVGLFLVVGGLAVVSNKSDAVTTFTITVDDVVLVSDGLGYNEQSCGGIHRLTNCVPNSETREDYINRKIIEYLQSGVKRKAYADALKTATEQATITANNVRVSIE